MGCALSCEKCKSAAESCVINFSDSLISRVVDGIEPRPPKGPLLSIEEMDWLDKIKCLDDTHSALYGLSISDIETLLARAEANFRKNTLPVYCAFKNIKACYGNHATCSITCSKDANLFIECMDAKRLQKLKVLLATARKKKREEERKRRQSMW